MLQIITVALYGTKVKSDRFEDFLKSEFGEVTTSAPEDEPKRSKCFGKCDDSLKPSLSISCNDGSKSLPICTALASNLLKEDKFWNSAEPMCSWTIQNCGKKNSITIPERNECPEVSCPVGHGYVLNNKLCKVCSPYVSFSKCCRAGCQPRSGCHSFECNDDGSFKLDNPYFCWDTVKDTNNQCICKNADGEDIIQRPESSTRSSSENVVSVQSWISNKIESKVPEEKGRIKKIFNETVNKLVQFVLKTNERNVKISEVQETPSQYQIEKLGMDQVKNWIKEVRNQQEYDRKSFSGMSVKDFYLARVKYGINNTVHPDICTNLQDSLKQPCKLVIADYVQLQEDFDKIPERIKREVGNLTDISDSNIDSFDQVTPDQIEAITALMYRKIKSTTEKLLNVDKIVKQSICSLGATIANSAALRRFAKLVSNARNTTARQVFGRIMNLISKPIDNLRQHCRTPENKPIQFVFRRHFRQWLLAGNYSNARQAFERLKTKVGDLVSDKFCDDCQCNGETNNSNFRCLAKEEECTCLPQVETARPIVVAVSELQNQTIMEIRDRLTQVYQRIGDRVRAVVTLTRKNVGAGRRLGSNDDTVVYEVVVDTEQSNYEQDTDANTEADLVLGQFGAIVGAEEQDVESDDIEVMEEEITRQQSSTDMPEEYITTRPWIPDPDPVSDSSSVVFATAVLSAVFANVLI
jgi:hypothetical protein